MSDIFNFTDTDNVFNNLVSDDPSIVETQAVVTGDIPASNLELEGDTDPNKKRQSALSLQLQKSNTDFLDKISAPTPMTAENYLGSAVKSVNPEYVDKFKYQEGYNPLEFNPNFYESNTKQAIENETWGSALAKGFDSMLYNAGNTYVSWFSDYGKMFDAISEGDWDLVKPSEDELISQYYLDQKNASQNYVFVPEEDEDGIFNRKFFSEFLGNVGFTYGTISAISTELAADVLITGLTGGSGIGSFGATGARALSKLGLKSAAKEGVELAAKRNFFTRFGSGLSLADKSVDAIKPIVREATEAEITGSFRRIPSATARETFNSYTRIFSNNILNIAKSKSLGEFAENILRGTPLLGTAVNFGEKGVVAFKAGASAAELTGMGVQGFRRVAQELNMSMSEAMFESVSSYGDSLDMMIKNYQSTHEGELPNAVEFNKMRDYAVQASSSNYDTNTAILQATNKLQFGNLFNKFVPANKTLQALEETMANNTIAAVRKKGTFKIFDKSGFFGTFGIVGKVKAEFGTKEAAKMLGKSFLRNSLSFEIAEGAQEIYQEASGNAWKNYYVDKYGNNLKYTLTEYFGQGFKDQWSKQGLKTFLTGALTGMMVKGPSKVLNNVVQKTQEQYYNNKYKDNPNQNPVVQAKERLQADIKMINSVFESGGPNAFSNKVVNFNVQTISSAEMAEAAAKGLQYEFQNSKNNALLSATMAAYRTNTIKGFVSAIRDMGQDYTAEEFQKEFNIDIADTNYNTPQEYAEKVANDLEKYTKIIEDMKRGVKNKLVDVQEYQEGTIDRTIANHTRAAQEEAISIIAMNAIKADMTVERLKDVTADLASVPGIGLSSDYAMRVLSNPSFLSNEIDTVISQIKQLDTTLEQGNLTGDVKKQTEKQLKNAKKELDLLNEWAKLWKQRGEITGVAEQTDLVFAGIELNKKQRVENADGKKLWTPVKTWDIKNKKISKLFRNIINLKNSQAGLDAELGQSSLNDSFEKIIDYIRLDKDSKDYMRAVEVLSDPDKFMSMVKRSEAGLFKYNIESLISNLEEAVVRVSSGIASNVSTDPVEHFKISNEIYQQIFDRVKESDSYIALNIIITDPKIGIEAYKDAKKYINEIEQIISLEIHKAIKQYTPQQYNEDITEGEMNDIQEKKSLDDYRLLTIAEKVMNNTELLPNEAKLYEDPIYKEQIDYKIQELGIIGYAPKVNVVQNEDGTADVVDVATGDVVNEEPLTVEEAEELKSEIDNLPSETIVANIPDPSTIKTPVIAEDDEDTEGKSVETVSPASMLQEFLSMSDASKIKTLEMVREFNPKYKALKVRFAKQEITKDEYYAEVDKINATIFKAGAEKENLKFLLDKVKAQNSNTSANVNSQPNQPASTAPSQVAPVSTDAKVDIEAKKADVKERNEYSLSTVGNWSGSPINGRTEGYKIDYIEPGNFENRNIIFERKFDFDTKEEAENWVNSKYNAELAALQGVKPANESDIVTVYHHTTVAPKDFNFGNFQRGKEQISQFGDGLNASSTTTPFFVQRYGKPIQGEIKDSEFIVIDANKSEKELYEYLVSKGYKFNNPMTGSYIGKSPVKEYDGSEKANKNPAIISLFNDLQKSNPQVKGVKVINHIIGAEKIDPFYVIYDAKSFYGPGSLSKTQTQTKAAEPIVDMQQAEELVRQMVKPNGKVITNFTSEEQALMSKVPVQRKMDIQKEEEVKFQKEQDDKLKKDEDYTEMADDMSGAVEFDSIFGDQLERKIEIQKENRDFVKDYLNTEDEELINAFMSRAIEALDAHNKKVNGTIELLSMFSRIPSVKADIEELRKNVLASVTDEFDEEEAVDFEDFFNMGDVAEVEEDAKITVDDSAPTEIQNNDIQSILEDYNQAKSDISKKSSKFVEKGDQSLLDEINDIHDEPGC